MTLTIKQMYDRYSVREFCRKIEIKRLQTNGTYESTWQNVEELTGLKLLDDSVQSINYKVSNNSYNFGIVNVGNVTVKLNSKNGQFDDESNSGSIFKNFVRHKSLLRIRDGYVDYYTNPDSPVSVYTTVFQGFIDITATGTKVDDQNLIQSLQCIDVLSFLLKQYTLADMGTLTSTDLDDLIYEILNRSEFTDFFTVNAVNITPGYNIASFDVTQYEAQTQLFTLFENFSIGHSFFYIKNDVFYYSSILTAQTNTLSINSKKTIKFSAYSSGIPNVYELFFWQDQPTITFTSESNKYNRSVTIEIKGVTNDTQRQNVLNAIGNIAKIQRKEFNLTIPYYMDIYVMDKILVSSPEIYPDDAFIWGVSKWGDGKKWRRSFKADNITNNVYWLVKEVKHSKNLQTSLLLQEIIE